MEDTIAAISTPPGAAGLGIIRISGEGAVSIAQGIFRSYSGKKLDGLRGYNGMLGHIIYKEQIVDEAIAFVYKSPRSYTGEDVVELSCHGGTVIMRTVLRACLDNGARLAQAGEFTRRAFMNGKMDLIQAESVMRMINSQGQASLRAAAAAKDGALSRRIESVKNMLVGQSSHIAAWCDYPEEGVLDVDESELGNVMRECRCEIQKLLSTYDLGRLITDGISTVIVGKPNVGKSTIMNMLSGYEKSIVTDIPGTTRDIIEDTVSIGELVLKLKDTAGIRSARDSVEKIGVERSIKSLDNADMVLAVFDNSEDISDEDEYILSLASDCPVIAVLNKNDLPTKSFNPDKYKNIVKTVSISARTGEGMEELIRAINEAVKFTDIDDSQVMITNERQRSALRQAEAAIDSAVRSLDGGITLDAICADIDYAIEILMSLTGENASDKIIDEVFSRFCVGK